MNANGWRVLLLGGNSGVGKTHLSKQLIRELGISALMVDDVRIALQQITSPIQHPDLHVFLDYQPEQWLMPEKIVKDWVRVGNSMNGSLKEIIVHHIVAEGSGKIIIEGDGVLPSLAHQSTFNKIPGLERIDIQQKIQAIFLIEKDENQILANLRKRGRGFDLANLEQQQAFAKASSLFAQWLTQEAYDKNVPVLAARPRETILERVLEIAKASTKMST